MTELWLGFVDCRQGDLGASLAEAKLSPQEVTQLDRYRQPDHQRCFVEGRRLARTMLAALSGSSEPAIHFEIDPQGKPWCPGQSGWHFNLSHSGHLVACACAQNIVGLDIEIHRPGKDLNGLAGRFFAPEEAQAISHHPALFYDYWVLKEAILKYQGVGMVGLAKIPGFSLESNAAIPILPLRPGQEAWHGFLARHQLSAADGRRWSLGLAAGEAWNLHCPPEFRLADGLKLSLGEGRDRADLAAGA